MAYGTLNAGVIDPGSGDSLSITLGSSAGDDFNVDSGKLLVEGDTGLVSIGTGGDFETSTTGKVHSKGNCVQTSFHSSLIFGY